MTRAFAKVEVQLAAADPKILRYRLLDTAARIVPPRARASAQQGRVVVAVDDPRQVELLPAPDQLLTLGRKGGGDHAGPGAQCDQASVAHRGDERVGARYSVTSCDLRVLMDQPTESISPHDPPSRHDHS